jgi:hypothetical protein
MDIGLRSLGESEVNGAKESTATDSGPRC